MDWSLSDKLAVALDTQLFVWKPNSDQVAKIAHLENDNMICSVNWSKRAPLVGYGDSQGVLRVVDVEKNQMIAEMEGHKARIGSLAWNGNLIASGS